MTHFHVHMRIFHEQFLKILYLSFFLISSRPLDSFPESHKCCWGGRHGRLACPLRPHHFKLLLIRHQEQHNALWGKRYSPTSVCMSHRHLWLADLPSPRTQASFDFRMTGELFCSLPVNFVCTEFLLKKFFGIKFSQARERNFLKVMHMIFFFFYKVCIA